MRNARWEIPEIADADIVDEVVSVGIDGGDARAAVEHVSPFGGLVPMKLAKGAGIEAHVDAGDVLGNPELPHRDLAGPAAGLLPHMRVREREAQIRQRPVIGRGWVEHVGVLQIPEEVARTGIGPATAGTLRLWHGLTGLRPGHRRHGQYAGGGSRRQNVTPRDSTHDTHSLTIWSIAAPTTSPRSSAACACGARPRHTARLPSALP